MTIRILRWLDGIPFLGPFVWGCYLRRQHLRYATIHPGYEAEGETGLDIVGVPV